MIARDVEIAAVASQTHPLHLCRALETVLPVLRTLYDRGGHPFWLRWGMNALIGALEGYQREACP